MKGVSARLALLGLLLSAEARADLRDDARRVAAQWAEAGQRVTRRDAFFLEQGRRQRLRIDETGGDCASVLVLAPRASEFSLRAPLAGEAATERATGGLGFVSLCGERRALLSALWVEMRAARGAFEVVVATGASEAPDPRESLPERRVVAGHAMLDPGRAPSSEALVARTARAEARARSEEATETRSEEATASDEGLGRLVRPFREGCHRVEVLAEAGTGGRVADVDLELRSLPSDALIARDRSDTADARVDFCVGEPGAAALLFRGAPARGAVRVVLSRWALPASLPAIWGPRVRASMAFALQRRRLAAPRGRPLRAVTGLGGTTSLTLELVPGACYVWLLGLARGEVRGLHASALLEGQVLHDEGGSGRDGLALSFCSRTTERLPVSIESRGGSPVWGAALWRLGEEP